MKYILLLRGVNVGGKNRVDMPELKRQLEQAGFRETETYLNSGNALLDSDRPREETVRRVRDLLRDRYEFEIPFTLLGAEMLHTDLRAIPLWWSEPLARRDILPGKRHRF